jgi:hypothetical protein
MDTIPGADTLGFGFDILKPYDKSSTTSQLFNFGELDKSQLTIGGIAHGVPENIAVHPDKEKKGDSQVFSTRQQVQDHFSTKAGITGSGFGFKGHFDMSYSKTSNSDKSYYYALVEASDRSYTLKLAKTGKSWFDKDFADEMNDLPEVFSKDTQDEFFSFFIKYGTHYVTQVELGGHLYYYVAIDKSFSSDETVVKANMNAEYKGVFGKVKAEAESTWKQLGKNWANSRIVSLQAQGGDTSIFDSLEPGFGEWKGDSFTNWTQSLGSQPGVSGFTLALITQLFSGKRANAARAALVEYLKGGLIVSADRDATPGKRQEFTAYPTIIGPNGLVSPPTAPPMPERPNIDVAGIQVVLFEPNEFKEILNRVHYVTPPSPASVAKMYADILKEIKTVPTTNYYCAVSIFGLHSAFYPPPDMVGWLSECGAQLTSWKNLIGKTAAGGGVLCYTLGGRKGSRVGAKEDFRMDTTQRSNKLNSSAIYFLFGGGLRSVAEG